ncbi:MAG: ion transporter [Lachnospiraceae bacterium]|nr:ion transporter [Lachnospiraceae bacterium]
MIKGLKKVVDHKAFQGFILFIIVFNSVVMGIETISGLPDKVVLVLGLFNNVCLWIFIIEMLLKFLAYGMDYFKDPWNWFDMVIIGTSLISALPFMAALRAFRVLRVLRSLKALRSMRLVSSIHHLQIILIAIVRSVPSILWTGLLMILIYYIFALIGVNLFGEAFPDWFGTVGKAMYTLFQVMTLESWSMGISRPVMEVYSAAWLYFVPFVLISSFIVMNVVVGIVVNSISEVTAEDTKKGTDEEEEEKDTDRIKALTAEIKEMREMLARMEQMIEKK